MSTDHEIDIRLRAEGARWRSQVPIDRDVADVRFGEPVGGRLLGRLVLGLGSLGVLVAVVAVLTSLRLSPSVGLSDETPGRSQPAGPESAATPAATALDLNIVRPGDAVVATGAMAEQRGDVYLCPTKLLGITGGIGCLGDLVIVRNAQSWRGDVRVEGVWDGQAIEATAITREKVPSGSSWPPIPCDPPAGGWPSLPTGDDGESTGRALEQEVGRHPERYIGLWPAATTNAAGDVKNRALVVGTVDDVQSVTQALTAIYPFNLCVVRSDFSAAELEPVVDELESLDYPWHVGLEPRVGRVEVWTTALTPEMAEALAPFSGKVALQTALRRSTDPETRRFAVIHAVNTDPVNFGGVYLEDDGTLVILYVGANAGGAIVERLASGMAVRWEKVERSSGELRQAATEIRERSLNGVTWIAIDTIRNRVHVGVGPGGSVADVSRLLAEDYGDGVYVSEGDVLVTLPAMPSASP